MNSTRKTPPRVLLLSTVRSYRLDAFRQAAARLGIEITNGIDLPSELAGNWADALPIDFSDLEGATRRIVDYDRDHPLSAILAVDDSGSLLAAHASAELQLPHNEATAAAAARDKYEMRRRLKDAGVPTPWFRRFRTSEAREAVAAVVSYPCVVKPTNLNGSRGVIRANDPLELRAAIDRLVSMLAGGDEEETYFLVEDYMPGVEVALEGLMDDGLRVLAIFDKPDPLEGPFFEETIYVTPSRLPAADQAAIHAATADAARALGLSIGPIHAELRVHNGHARIIEIAGRSIGGLCSQVLRFGVDIPLEEVILRQAAGLPQVGLASSGWASGVMMIPIPEAGLLRDVKGLADARAVPLIESVEISARLNYPLVPLPEGDSYLGFIFARGETPAEVESALRAAHACLTFRIEPVIALIPA